MKFNVKISSKTNIKSLDSDCLIIMSNACKQLDLPKETKIYLTKILAEESLLDPNNFGKAILLFAVPGLKTKRVLIVASNKDRSLSEHQFLEIPKTISTNLNKHKINNATILLQGCIVTDKNMEWQLYQLSLHLANSSYIFDQYKSKKTNKNIFEYINFILPPQAKLTELSAKNILQQAAAVNKACNLIKNLANTPPNVCSTEFLAKAAIALKKKSNKLKVNVLEKKSLQKLNMGAFLAVAQGSLQPPKLICLEYLGANSKSAPIVLIGKGITFDTGGNSLKPANSMIGMKFDMCGAATVLGAIQFAIEMKLKLNIVGLLATAENMPGRHACRPDDVVTTMSGMTVEILNTDAEGRLLLCDALTYCQKFNPKVVIDLATLTGSCAATFGHFYSGLFGNNQELLNKLIAAGQKANDKLWQLPITEEYHKLLDSDIADLANIGGSHAGSITAACFLAKFAEKYQWAHIDIAGTAYYQDGKITRNPSGRPLPMLAQYLIDMEANSK